MKASENSLLVVPRLIGQPINAVYEGEQKVSMITLMKSSKTEIIADIQEDSQKHPLHLKQPVNHKMFEVRLNHSIQHHLIRSVGENFWFVDEVMKS